MGCPRETQRGVCRSRKNSHVIRPHVHCCCTLRCQVSAAQTRPLTTTCVANHRLEMSTTTPFRELPGRAKAVLPAWGLKKDKEEVTYTLKKCRGVPQNCIHDVSTCCQYQGLLPHGLILSCVRAVAVVAMGRDGEDEGCPAFFGKRKGVTGVLGTLWQQQQQQRCAGVDPGCRRTASPTLVATPTSRKLLSEDLVLCCIFGACS